MLLDTSGLLSLHNRDEPQHKSALLLFDAAERRITHNYVLAEFVALAYARQLPRKRALEFVVRMTDSPLVEVVGWISDFIGQRCGYCKRD